MGRDVGPARLYESASSSLAPSQAHGSDYSVPTASQRHAHSRTQHFAIFARFGNSCIETRWQLSSSVRPTSPWG